MEKKLKRDIPGKMVAGVAAGLAKYFELDVVWVRVAFALACFFGGGGLWVYIILWIAMPEEEVNAYTYTDYRVNPDEPKYEKTFKPKEQSKVSFLAGLLLIGFGSYFLLDEFDIIPHWFSLSRLWPLIFVAIGLSILFKGAKKANETNPFDPTNDKKKTEDTVEKEAETDQSSNNTNY
jgi:phage shock protein PspC (stress-responsive transcriptional regulator)